MSLYLSSVVPTTKPIKVHLPRGKLNGGFGGSDRGIKNKNLSVHAGEKEVKRMDIVIRNLRELAQKLEEGGELQDKIVLELTEHIDRIHVELSSTIGMSFSGSYPISSKG